MSKWAEVVITINKTYAVEIEDFETADDAANHVIDDQMGAEVEIISTTIAKGEREIQSFIDNSDEQLTQ